jgi:hypothetical protein
MLWYLLFVGARKGVMEIKGAKGQRPSPHVAPILYRIVNGSSSTSLNLTRARRDGTKYETLFRKTGFYGTVLYKYPNFKGAWPSTAQPQAAGGAPAADDRPIETGIYVPGDPKELMGGGYAIYVRQSGYREMLRDHLGLDHARQDPDLLHDLRVIGTLDDMPSVDPFLIKSRFEALKIPLSPNSLDIRPEEEQAVRSLIERRIEPVLIKASASGVISDEARRRTLEAIWNPSLPESARFVKAFGIHESECAKVFFALQGITFYEHLFVTAGEDCRKTAVWLREVAARPYDLRSRPRYDVDRQNLVLQEVGRAFAHTIKSMQLLFKDYDLALKEFVAADSPAPLRQFLLSAHRHFWTLGHGIMALTNCAQSVIEAEGGNRIQNFDLVGQTLARMRVSLASRAESHRL